MMISDSSLLFLATL